MIQIAVLETSLKHIDNILKDRPSRSGALVCLLVGCLTSQQHASVSQGRICSENLHAATLRKTIADQTFYLTQPQYTDTGLTSPSTDPITPGAWQGSHLECQFSSRSLVWLDPGKFRRKRESIPGSFALEADSWTTAPKRRSWSTSSVV